MMLFISNTHAALVTFNANGTVETADAGNDFLLDAGNIISATGTFDDTGFTGSGLEWFTTTLSMDIGSITLNGDGAYDGYTAIVFDDGVFRGFNFSSVADIPGPTAFFDSAFDFFNGEDDSFRYIDGTWNTASYTVVPVPAAVWLFASGLLGLAGLARRKTS